MVYRGNAKVIVKTSSAVSGCVCQYYNMVVWYICCYISYFPCIGGSQIAWRIKCIERRIDSSIFVNILSWFISPLFFRNSFNSVDIEVSFMFFEWLLIENIVCYFFYICSEFIHIFLSIPFAYKCNICFRSGISIMLNSSVINFLWVFIGNKMAFGINFLFHKCIELAIIIISLLYFYGYFFFWKWNPYRLLKCSFLIFCQFSSHPFFKKCAETPE